MKRFINCLGFTLMLALGVFFSRPVDAQPAVGVRASINFQTFYDELSPYGDWIDYPEYGYTWRPRVGNDFRPYSTNGNWVYTNDEDWMWNSGYNWGWAPFHYGRWFYDSMYGWLWVPGYDWSPAWVSWRGGGDYYGWAPIRPGISINIGFGNYNPPYDYWTFAPCRYMTSSYISRYYYPYRNNVNIFNRTTIINNYYGDRNRGRRGSYYVNGPRRTDVERYTGRINSVAVRSSNRPGRATMSRNAISVYRPSVQRNSNNANSTRGNYAPRTVQEYKGTRNSSDVASRGSVRRNDNRVMRNNSNNSNTQTRVNSSPVNRDRISNRSISRDNNNNSVNSDNNKNRTIRERNIMRQRSAINEPANSGNNDKARSSSIRSQQLEQRNQQMQRQRVQQQEAANQRSVEVRQRNQAIQQRRSAEATQQNEARQRSVQMRRQQEAQSSSRSVEAQHPSRSFQSSVPSRSFESRSSGSSAPRSSVGGRSGGGRRGR